MSRSRRREEHCKGLDSYRLGGLKVAEAVRGRSEVEVEEDRGLPCEEVVDRKHQLRTQDEVDSPSGVGNRGTGDKGCSEDEVAACALDWEAPRHRDEVGSHSLGVHTLAEGVRRGHNQESPWAHASRRELCFAREQLILGTCPSQGGCGGAAGRLSAASGAETVMKSGSSS